MAEKQSQDCAHPGCNCPAAKDSKYGTYCEGASRTAVNRLQLRSPGMFGSQGSTAPVVGAEGSEMRMAAEP